MGAKGGQGDGAEGGSAMGCEVKDVKGQVEESERGSAKGGASFSVV